MILQPGQSAAWTSNSTFLITVGNAGGVILTVDGQELPPLGKSGQVLRNIRLPFVASETQG
jgi:cytoskeleton protein RodZ